MIFTHPNTRGGAKPDQVISGTRKNLPDAFGSELEFVEFDQQIFTDCEIASSQ